MKHLEVWIGILMAAGMLVVVIRIARIRFVTAKPNEWLLVIRNGEMKSAGIGKQAFCGWNTQIVTFPSTIHKVQFKAQQVTKEMQGIEVSGFVVWVIYREDEGPFKAYKHLDGLGTGSGESPQASENIARMAESIIRHQVANSTIAEVITQREKLRDKIRSEMQAVIKGWGVWLETVEITDVLVLSKSLFEDLQASFRQETRKEAERIRMETERAIEEQGIRQKFELEKQRAEAVEQQKLYEARQRFAREKEEAQMLEEQIRIQRDTLEHKHVLEQLRQSQSIALAEIDAAHRLDLRRRELELEGGQAPWSQRLELLRTLERVYTKLPLKEIKLVQMSGGTSDLLTSLLTQLKMVERSLEESQPEVAQEPAFGIESAGQ